MTNEFLRQTQAPPVMAAREWLSELSPTLAPKLLNLSQAAPTAPPPLGLRQALAEAALNQADAHLYGPVRGLPELRRKLAENWSAAYECTLDEDHVTITSGCNQAFCTAITALATTGDSVLIPAPWYFNHEMFLTMHGIEARAIPCSEAMIPDLSAAEALIDARTKAIALVSPNNPTGAEYDPELIEGFFKLAEKHGLALILDETYRDFDGRETLPHALFNQKNWGDTFIHLYSFSKAFRLTGHRVGALITGKTRSKEIEKVLDTQTICPNQLAQIGALWGLEHLMDWVAEERLEVLRRKEAVLKAFEGSAWKVKSAGAYFAFLEHPYESSSDILAKKLVHEAQVLLLPGTMFVPNESETLGAFGQKHFRMAFANVDETQIKEAANRLMGFQSESR